MVSTLDRSGFMASDTASPSVVSGLSTKMSVKSHAQKAVNINSYIRY